MNYSRRINRPSFFQLMPFIDYTDPLNLRQGNPALTPEFTNSIEVNYSYIFNGSHNLLFSSYFKHTTDLITNYQYKGQNPATKDSAIFNTYINANSSQRYGLELTSRNAFTKKFDLTTNLNFYNAKINSENIEQNLSNSQFSFFGKMTATQKIGKNNQWTIQANGDYQSKTVLPAGGGGRGFGGMNFGGGIQAAGSNGFVNPNYGMDLSIRRDIIKNKTGQGYQGSITISMNDVFRSRIYDVSTSSDFFEQTLRRRRDPRIVRLQFNWRFGKVDTNLFRRKNLKGEMEGMSEGMSGAGN
jgi:outer membrane receptor protein involved in Fe transport